MKRRYISKPELHLVQSLSHIFSVAQAVGRNFPLRCLFTVRHLINFTQQRFETDKWYGEINEKTSVTTEEALTEGQRLKPFSF
jgi:hypothetical protein